MEVILTRGVVVKGRDCKAGERVDVPAAYARAWLASGLATEVVAKRTPKKRATAQGSDEAESMLD